MENKRSCTATGQSQWTMFLLERGLLLVTWMPVSPRSPRRVSSLETLHCLWEGIEGWPQTDQENALGRRFPLQARRELLRIVSARWSLKDWTSGLVFIPWARDTLNPWFQMRNLSTNQWKWFKEMKKDNLKIHCWNCWDFFGYSYFPNDYTKLKPRKIYKTKFFQGC